jgi:hypothetical protein
VEDQKDDTYSLKRVRGRRKAERKHTKEIIHTSNTVIGYSTSLYQLFRLHGDSMKIKHK